MNKSVMKCCICNNENIGQFITINNKKYHLCCIEQLQQENKKLNGTIQTYDILLKANVEENKQLKEKLDCDLQWAFKYEKQVDNWNKLKEYMIKEQTRIVIENTDEDEFVYTDLLNKMQELEQGSDE